MVYLIDGIRAHIYELPLHSPYSRRKGILLQWPDSTWTEASPLDGWSPDSFEDVFQAIEKRNWNAPLPSLQFGLQKLEATHEPIPFCALLVGTPSAIFKKSNGLKHAKLKLAKIPFDQAMSLTKELSKKMKLRIDFNGSLSLEQALIFAKECESDAIEFYEEPLKNSSELQYFPFPIALDESLRKQGFEKLANLSHVVALVIKPTMTGNLASCKAYEKFGKPLVLSSAFESGVGIAQILRFAPHLNSILSLGIDTYRYLKKDVLAEPLRFENGLAYPLDQVRVIRRLCTSRTAAASTPLK